MQWIGYLSCCQYQLFQFSSQILKGSDHGVTGFLNTRKDNVSDEGKTEIQLDSSSETLCFLVFRILDDE
jgi:hypothetical protein